MVREHSFIFYSWQILLMERAHIFFYFYFNFLSNERANPKTKESIWCGLSIIFNRRDSHGLYFDFYDVFILQNSILFGFYLVIEHM